MSRESYLAEVRHGSLYVGSPETVAQKIANTLKALGADRFDFKYMNGPLEQSKALRSIELYADKVIPRVNDILSSVAV